MQGVYVPQQQQQDTGGYVNMQGVYIPQHQAGTFQPVWNNGAPAPMQQQQPQPYTNIVAPAYNPSFVPPQHGQPYQPVAPIQVPCPSTNNPNNGYLATAYNADAATDAELTQTLAGTSKFIIKQDIEYLEAAAQAVANAANLAALGAVGEQANSYNIFTDTAAGGKQFQVKETSNYFCRCCLRPNHELQLHVYNVHNGSNNSLLMMDRPWKCGHCCSCHKICQQEMKVYQGNGVTMAGSDELDPSKMIGYIQEPLLGGILSPKLNVMEREGGPPIATIQAEAKCCIGGMCCNHTFHVTNVNGNYMGKIVKERPGNMAQIAKELTSDADNFTLHVDKNLPVKQKASMLAALHLIDYMFFENEGDLAVDFRNQSCRYKCFDWYFCGAVVPCQISCQKCWGKKKEKLDDYYQQSNSSAQQQHHPPPPHQHHHHHPPPPPHHHHHHFPPHHVPGHLTHMMHEMNPF